MHYLKISKTTATLLLVFFAFTRIVNAQDKVQKGDTLTKSDTTKAPIIKPWKIKNEVSLTFSQVSLTNWVAGGENTISGNGHYGFASSYSEGDNSWDNTFDAGYGQTRQGTSKNIKNDDRIEVSSKFGRKASAKWFYSVLATFKTQMFPGYNYPNDSTVVSDWLAPGYLGLSFGMDYKPSDRLSIFLSPVSGRLTVVQRQDLANEGSYGVKAAVYDQSGNLIKKGEHYLYEAGALVRIQLIQPIFKKKLLWTSKLDLFSNFIKDPQNVYVNWENTLEAKLNSWLTARLFMLAIYDDNARIAKDTNGDGINDRFTPKIQMKEIFGIGIGIKWKN
ncbi:MAG TPA: DUF3078 domain-containing protein [Williamwhitmania sp.]|nr:DUF3078 domain-containing protein [Williamwhitmania sp.]